MRKIPHLEQQSDLDRLPDEKLRKVTPGMLRFDLGTTLALVLLINILAYLFFGHITNNYGYWVVKSKWRLLAGLEEPVDWLILGDSSANQGVMPSVIREASGKSSANLATIGNMILVDDLWMLEYYLERHASPEKVILVHVTDMWHREFPAYLVAEIPLPWRYWERFSLSSELVSEDDIPTIYHDRFFILLYSTSLRNMIYKGVTTFTNTFDTGYAITKDGFFPAYEAKPETVVLGDLDLTRFMEENAFELSQHNEWALQQMIRLAEEHDFHIYIVTGPGYAGLHEEPAFQAYHGQLQDRLFEISLQTSRLHVVREIMSFTAEQMQNPDHLIVPGAEQYTRWLVEKVSE